MSTRFLPLIILIAIGAFALGTIFSPTTVTTSTSNDGTALLTYHSKVCKQVTRADGTVEDLGCSKNLLTQLGMNFTRNQLAGALTGAVNSSIGTGRVNIIAIANKTGEGPCNAALAPTDIFLCGEYAHAGLSRAAADDVRLNATNTFPTAGNWTITKQFTNTGSGALDVNATALTNTTTVNETGREMFFAENTFTTATLQANDKINITWFVWVT